MASIDSVKKYVVFEQYLNAINSKAIALQEKDITSNNIILNRVTETIITQMKAKDPLFAVLFKEKFYGGSYYDGLKVGNPNEFDLDMILKLPDIIGPRVECSSKAAFVKVEIRNFVKILEKPEAVNLEKLLDNNFLSTNKVLEWIEGLITKALKELEEDAEGPYVYAALDSTKPQVISKVYARVYKSGPAFTLGLSYEDAMGFKQNLNIDLVPCFQFFGKDWPTASKGYRKNTTKKDRFLVVPKQPKGPDFVNLPDIAQYWRLSFQEQERELISDDKKFLKPTVKLLKKLRDNYNHQIASYFIKTVFLWTVLEEDPSFWSKSLSFVFMSMLKKYAEYMRKGQIPYFWNPKYNLIGHVKDVTGQGIANMLLKVVKKVDNSLTDAEFDYYIIGKYLISPEQDESIKAELKPSKNQKKQIQAAATKKVLHSSSLDTTDSTPPLQRLGFDQFTLDYLKQYSNMLSSGQRSPDPQVGLLKSIDQKMDRILTKFDELLGENKSANDKIAVLEEKVKQLVIENRRLQNRAYQRNSGETNSIDELLGNIAAGGSDHHQPDLMG